MSLPALAEITVFLSLSGALLSIQADETRMPSHLSAGFFQTLLSLAG
jgi:hypothetical protein